MSSIVNSRNRGATPLMSQTYPHARPFRATQDKSTQLLLWRSIGTLLPTQSAWQESSASRRFYGGLHPLEWNCILACNRALASWNCIVGRLRQHRRREQTLTRIILVRHGHVEGIDPPRFRGREDLALTERGKAEAFAA